MFFSSHRKFREYDDAACNNQTTPISAPSWLLEALVCSSSHDMEQLLEKPVHEYQNYLCVCWCTARCLCFGRGLFRDSCWLLQWLRHFHITLNLHGNRTAMQATLIPGTACWNQSSWGLRAHAGCLCTQLPAFGAQPCPRGGNSAYPVTSAVDFGVLHHKQTVRNP